MTKEVKIHNEEKTVSLISCVRKTGQLHAKKKKKRNWTIFLYHKQKLLKLV